MANKTLTPIKVENVPNGYTLNVNGQGYMYFTTEELVEGFLVHVGMKEADFLSRDAIKKLIEACLKWKDNGKLVKELTKCKTTIERLEGNNRQMKKKLSKYEDGLDDLD